MLNNIFSLTLFSTQSNPIQPKRKKETELDRALTNDAKKKRWTDLSELSVGLEKERESERD